MDYPDEMYADKERQLAKWATDDAMESQRRATAAAMRGDRYAAKRYNDHAARCLADAEYHEQRI